jgi:gliding motility-associated-like protein
VEGKSSEGLYSVLLTNSFGCSATDETTVGNECIPKLVAPTAFRPASSNAANREFSVFSFFIVADKFQIYIYNRWGELVYQSNDRAFRWNGNLNNVGAPLAGGTYAYVIKYVSSFEPSKGIQEKHGGVVLLR